MKSGKVAKSVTEYIANEPKEIQKNLKALRATIKKNAPKSEEKISYGMPAYKLEGMLVYFAAYKTHIGFYPTSSGVAAFEKELSKYSVSKGTVRFPIDRLLPLTLIGKIVKFRAQENIQRKKKIKLKIFT